MPVSLAVQSWSFREFKEPARLIAKVEEVGLRRVELCGVHADFARPETFDATIATYHAAGLAIDAIGVQGFAGDPGTERNFFEFAKRAGARTITVDFRIDSVPASFATAERLAEEYGIDLGIHNHGGRHWLGNAQMLQQVFATTGPRIGLCLDTAWALDAGEDPVAMIERFGQRLHGVHLKDFVFDRARRPEDVVVGTGNLDLAKLAAAFGKVGYAGYVAIEYERDASDPAPAIAKCVAAAKAAFGQQAAGSSKN